MIAGAIFIAMLLAGAVAGISKGLKDRSRGLVWMGVLVGVICLAAILALVFGG